LIRAIRKVAAEERYLTRPLSERRMDAWLQRTKPRTLDPYDALTGREREVLNLVSEGHSSASIASRLSISRRTAETHRANVRKLHVNNQVDLVRFAIARGIVALPSDPLRHAERGSGGSRRTERRSV
jgi:DNA-binding CsgD family transcriptional regulator